MNKEKNFDLKVLFLNIAIIIAAIVLVVLTCALIADMNSNYKDYNNKASSYLNPFKRSEYNDTIDMYYHDLMHDKGEKDLPECMAVTEYFIMSSFYEMYKESDVKGAEYAKKMQDAKSRMGDFTYMSEEIDAIFENREK